jgi:hypothetical protein
MKELLYVSSKLSDFYAFEKKLDSLRFPGGLK